MAGFTPSGDRRGRVALPGLAALLLAGCGAGAGEPVADPVAGYRPPEVVRRDGAVWVENAGPRERLRVRVGEPRGRLLFVGGGPADTVGRGGVRAVARTVREFELAPVRPGEPLVRLVGRDGRVVGMAGTVELPENPFLGQLANAGWAVADGGGGAYFAPALAPELRRYDEAGRLLWRAVRPLADPPPPPRLAAVEGMLQPQFTVVQHGLALGPDGLVYLLGSADGAGVPDRVYVFDREGRLVREGAIPPGHAVYVDRRGRVTAVPRAAGGASAEREPFPLFDLPALAGGDTLRLADHAGRVVVLNFWASWCGPCRREMPLLDDLARELAPRGVVVIGLNEDTDADAAGAFAARLGVGYPSAAGGGRLKERYRYRGLPYTVVLDRRLRVVRTIYGFGGSIAPVRAAVEAALAEPPGGSGGGGGPTPPSAAGS